MMIGISGWTAFGKNDHQSQKPMVAITDGNHATPVRKPSSEAMEIVEVEEPKPVASTRVSREAESSSRFHQNQQLMEAKDNQNMSYGEFRSLLNVNVSDLALSPRVQLQPPSEDQLFTQYYATKFQATVSKEDSLITARKDADVVDRVTQRMGKTDDYVDFMTKLGKDEEIEALMGRRKEKISNEDKEKITKILNGPPSSQVVIDKFNIDMTRNKIVCLRPGTWLNDEVVNFYMAMLLDRDTRLCEEAKAKGETRYPSYFFNSFFVSKLLEGGSYDYARVKRWTKKFDVFAQDKIFFPVNLNNTHWTMAVVFIRKQEIHYYDSMSGSGRRYLDALLLWVVDEAKEKKKITINKSEWKLISNEDDVPQQRNGFDCGMFSIMCADYLADDLPFGHSQDEMPLNRLKVGAAILNGTLPY